MILGYIFWLLISNLTGAETIGRVAAAMALGWILTSISTLGIPTGIQRFLGIAVAENNASLINRYSKVSIFLLAISSSILTLSLVLLSKEITLILNLPQEMFFISIIMVLGAGIYQLLRAVMVSTLKTKMLLVADTLGEISRIIVTVVLITSFYGDLGILSGFLALFLIPSLILLPGFIKILGRYGDNVKLEIRKTSAIIIKASSVSWIPTIITQFGTQMGLLIAFGFLGGFETGIYFIAFALFSIIFAIPSSILSIAYPTISGMKTGKEQFLHASIKFALILSIPISVAAMIYSSSILALFGGDFQVGSLITLLLLISVVPSTVSTAFVYLAYSHGKYGYVMAIGLVGSGAKVALYPFLIPLFGALGVSIAFLVGSVFALLASIVIGRNMNFRPKWLEIGLMSVTATVVGIPFVFVQSAALGIIVITGVSWVLYIRLGIVKLDEARYILSATLPDKLAATISNGIERVDKFLK
jgi:O-antigen/teichoic acid export membrane protein